MAKCTQCSKPVILEEAHVVLPNQNRVGHKRYAPTHYVHLECFQKSTIHNHELRKRDDAIMEKRYADALAAIATPTTGAVPACEDKGTPHGHG